MPYDIKGDAITGAFDLGGNSLAAVYDLAGNEYPFNSPYITVMTFNTQYWSAINAKRALIEKMFQDNKPTLVGLQECPNDGGYIPTFFRRFFKNTETNAPLGVMTNIPCYDISTHVYESCNGDSIRGYIKFKIRVVGKEITVFNTHIEVLGTTQHYSQPAELMAEAAKESSFIALGDFNLETHIKTGNEYPNMVKPIIDAGYNLCNWTDETGFVDTWFGGSTPTGYICPCDNIITSADIEVVDIVYDQTKILANTGMAIDHIPVIARLRVN